MNAPQRIGIAILSGLVAVSAYVGGLGLILGFLKLGATVTERLPLQSPVLGGIALTVIVAVPCTVLPARGHQAARSASTLVGALIVSWILIELTLIRELSFFHPIYIAIGLALVWLGVHRPRPPSATRV